MTFPTDRWQNLPKKCTFAINEVHIIRAFISKVFPHYDLFWSYLNTEEKQRALRYRFDKDRHQCVTSRGILRDLLARFYDKTAPEINFQVTNHGKLFFSSEETDLHLEFNMSHAHNCIVYAFTRQIAIGVDVEFPKKKIDLLGIAKRFFSEYEYQQLQNLPDHEKYLGFYNTWTRKEAYIKAIGEGLSHPLDTFDVTLLPNEPARFLRIDNSYDVTDWTLQAFCPSTGYFAAFATKQPVSRVWFWEWEK